MKFLPLIWAGLWRKRMRTVLTLLGVATAFTLFGLLQYVDEGFQNGIKAAHEDRLFVNGAYGRRIPLTANDEVLRVPGVVRTAYNAFIFGAYKKPGEPRGVSFVTDEFWDMRDELIVTRAQRDELARTRDGILVTLGMAKQDDLKVGDTFVITSPNAMATKDGTNVYSFHVVGVIDNRYFGENHREAFGNFEYYKETRATPTIGSILVQVRDPADVTRVGKEIDKIFQNSGNPTRSTGEVAMFRAGMGSLGDANFLINGVAFAVMFMLLFITANTLMQAVRERAGEFAVMTTLGFSNGGVLALVAAESILLCLLGGAIGLTCAVLASPVLAAARVPHTQHLSLNALAVTVGVALLIGVLSSLLPLRRLRRMSTVDVLAGR